MTDTTKTDTKEFIRVTEVLYPFSGLSQIDPNIIKQAANRGTIVHEICLSYLGRIGSYDIPDNCKGYIESFKQWQHIDKSFEFVPRLYCKKYGITGEIDGIYYCPERRKTILFDWKTSSKESKTWKLQGSAYAYLLRQSGYEVNGIEFVKLLKNGKLPEVFSYEEDFETFLKCLDLYHIFFKDKFEAYEYI